MKATDYQKWLVQKTILNNPYIPHAPTKKQLQALLCDKKDMLYGGAAGGGKSDFLLMAALQYAASSNYSALLLRRTFADLNKSGALIPRSHEWLANTNAHWDGVNKRWTFPNGSTLQFGHIEHEKNKYNYQGGEYQFIGFDEITHFTETQYSYLFSRLRKLASSPIPARIRSAGNPDGIGFEWVKRRFVKANNPERPYIPSSLDDNPYLNAEDYEKSLDELDAITRERLRFGNWDIMPDGEFFKISEIKIIDELPFELSLNPNWHRYWDLAATAENGTNDPDYTVGAKVLIHDGIAYVMDVVRGRWDSSKVDKRMMETALMDGPEVPIAYEEEGGSSGKRTTNYLRDWLVGFPFRGIRSTGSKEQRARPFSSWLNAGKVVFLYGPWNSAVLDEFALFPSGKHDDQVDAIAGAFNQCAKKKQKKNLDVMMIGSQIATQQSDMSF